MSLSPETTAQLSDVLRRLIREGYTPIDRLAIEASEWLDDSAPLAELRAAAAVLVEGILAQHRQEAAGWPAVTDCQRLDAAFSALEADGIVARQNFTCCQSCGHAEIAEQIDCAERSGQVTRGYTFFHQQDTESAVEYGSLYLAYGATSPGGPGAMSIAQDVVAALRKQGLTVTWGGSTSQRIGVSLDWKRRLSPTT